RPCPQRGVHGLHPAYGPLLRVRSCARDAPCLVGPASLHAVETDTDRRPHHPLPLGFDGDDPADHQRIRTSCAPRTRLADLEGPRPARGTPADEEEEEETPAEASFQGRLEVRQGEQT